MYGFLNVEEGYGLENQCTVTYGEWDVYAFYLNESPKLLGSIQL